eukprot:scaffold2098_cov270-Chaetoceros_neogracile.AAC.30
MIGVHEQAITALSKTAKELKIQTEVNSILNSIVNDIETTHALEQNINHDIVVSNLQRKYDLAERALEEYKAMDIEKMEERQMIGEAFLQDLMALEEMMETMEEGGSSGIDSNLAIVDASVEDEMIPDALEPLPEEEEEKEEEEYDQNQECASANGESITPTEITESITPTEITEVDRDGSYEPPSISEQIVPINHGPDAAAGEAGLVAKDSKGPPVAVQPSQSQSISILPQRKKPPTSLQHVNEKTLMVMFEYMDAMDILNMAQTNVQLYNKVDGIFGLGGTIEVGSRSMDEEHEGNDEPPVVLEDDEEITPHIEQEEIPVQGGGAPSLHFSDCTNHSTSDKSIDSQQRATIVSIPPVRSNNANKSVGQSTTKSSPSSAVEPTQTAVKISTTVKVPPKKEGKSGSNSKPDLPPSTTRSSTVFQMSPAVAQSLATKLLPAELSAIITMRDQLRKREEELKKSLEDVDDITAQLEGTMSVKEVLTGKVKDLQKTLNSDRDISAKITRQTASDQEVISFLDDRVQELEKAVDNFHAERTKANKSIEKVKDASERQVAILNDMLTYEREQRSDEVKEWKSTKKVLVKEVKHCRAQIMTLEAERDGTREENQRLKEALLSLGVGKPGRLFETTMS